MAYEIGLRQKAAACSGTVYPIDVFFTPRMVSFMTPSINVGRNVNFVLTFTCCWFWRFWSGIRSKVFRRVRGRYGVNFGVNDIGLGVAGRSMETWDSSRSSALGSVHSNLL